jgi:hypothetical protein
LEHGIFRMFVKKCFEFADHVFNELVIFFYCNNFAILECVYTEIAQVAARTKQLSLNLVVVRVIVVKMQRTVDVLQIWHSLLGY